MNFNAMTDSEFVEMVKTLTGFEVEKLVETDESFSWKMLTVSTPKVHEDADGMLWATVPVVSH